MTLQNCITKTRTKHSKLSKISIIVYGVYKIIVLCIENQKKKKGEKKKRKKRTFLKVWKDWINSVYPRRVRETIEHAWTWAPISTNFVILTFLFWYVDNKISLTVILNFICLIKTSLFFFFFLSQQDFGWLNFEFTSAFVPLVIPLIKFWQLS